VVHLSVIISVEGMSMRCTGNQELLFNRAMFRRKWLSRLKSWGSSRHIVDSAIHISQRNEARSNVTKKVVFKSFSLLHNWKPTSDFGDFRLVVLLASLERLPVLNVDLDHIPMHIGMR
jgi:hypothetical protein